MAAYRGLRGTLERLIVSDDQVDRQIEQLIDQHPRVTPVEGRTSQSGDELVLDYAGYADGVRFAGGTAERQTLVLGSGTFIPGFEEQLIGHTAGEDVDVDVTFPSEYHAPELAGKAALFKCHIHEVRVRGRYAPDDTFAREVTGLQSFEVLRQRVREGLQAYADRQAEEDLRARLLDQLMIGRDDVISREQLEHAIDVQIQSLRANLQQQGLTLEAYCDFMGKSEEQLRHESQPDAVKAIRRQRVIAEIARQEGIVADEDSVADAIQDICRQNGMTVEQLSAHLDEAAKNAIVQNVITGKVLDLIRDNAVIEVVEKQA